MYAGLGKGSEIFAAHLPEGARPQANASRWGTDPDKEGLPCPAPAGPLGTHLSPDTAGSLHMQMLLSGASLVHNACKPSCHPDSRHISAVSLRAVSLVPSGSLKCSYTCSSFNLLFKTKLFWKPTHPLWAWVDLLPSPSCFPIDTGFLWPSGLFLFTRGSTDQTVSFLFLKNIFF